MPKPALTLVDRPFLAYMVEWLAGPRRDGGRPRLRLPARRAARGARRQRSAAGVRIRYVAEPEPLGTAGAIRFAADALGDDLDERFLALNGDVLTDLDLTALHRRPRERGARATLGSAPGRRLPPPTASSRSGEDGAVLSFVEKTGAGTSPG